MLAPVQTLFMVYVFSEYPHTPPAATLRRLKTSSIHGAHLIFFLYFPLLTEPVINLAGIYSPHISPKVLPV